MNDIDWEGKIMLYFLSSTVWSRTSRDCTYFLKYYSSELGGVVIRNGYCNDVGSW